MKNLFVSVTNSNDREVHIGDNDVIDITINTRVGDDTVRVGQIMVSFTEGICMIELFDKDSGICGRTEMDVASKESVEEIGG